MYFRRKTSGGRAYLQIVESRREGDQVRQQVIATLGRYEDLKPNFQGLALSGVGKGPQLLGFCVHVRFVVLNYLGVRRALS